jgi:hypothetical protein
MTYGNMLRSPSPHDGGIELLAHMVYVLEYHASNRAVSVLSTVMPFDRAIIPSSTILLNKSFLDGYLAIPLS